MLVEGSHRRAEVDLRSIEADHDFVMFLRQSILFPENFTVGLDWTSANEEALNAGLKTEQYAVETDDYPTFAEVVTVFTLRCGRLGAEEDRRRLVAIDDQLQLFEDDDGND